MKERRQQGLLPELELFWSDHYSWLKDRGYLLRPRYLPEWKRGAGKPEDGVMPAFSFVVDATRISDGSLVLIKKIKPDTSDFPVFHEDQMSRRFSSEPLASDPKNRCVRMIEILSVPDAPDLQLIVMPFYYDWKCVPFLTIGEAVEFMSQIFEGLQFMHNNHIWHGDVKANNILMDASPLFVEPINPWKPRLTRDLTRIAHFRNRLRHPVKYYFIDFDLSGVHDSATGPPHIYAGYGGTRGVPEFANAKDDEECDPFAVDVYCLGNLIRTYFTEKMRGFEFMDGLVSDMTNKDPTKRPTIDEAVRRFAEIKAGLSGWKLRSRCATGNEGRLSRLFRFTPHWCRQLYYTARRIPSIPSP
ncbi:kinase-like domain-containing protein [Roridomyces roridus]|uniref:Kinase-like domain-containing protein n=1 Tax=Roridomyces roridus TaxID=1738132 RepID=A0AAD7CEM6_9AGAR|nr:kinase-like domain-containing protein [Roridomyces roridus]